jgi:hypothetical protein
MDGLKEMNMTVVIKPLADENTILTVRLIGS